MNKLSVIGCGTSRTLGHTNTNTHTKTTHSTLFFRCLDGSMVKVIIVAHVAVISRSDYKLHPGDQRTTGANDNTGVETVSLACLSLRFPGML